eukprot:CAMPEP_0205805490 /NCGR_PEP_ID=MMETSP0205-20121125/8737_1 /ASSEMBLY_ACC=CAM_ASM_000278 /TAXON_ID=36767 /ORGANISM="Euplotes focardii, Strain TN1" /LENGTH=114 /DNA_ID=CAMNT_0053076807 /DNA_START=14 /DNA_END=358 /DNA_ORIENTATION=-
MDEGVESYLVFQKKANKMIQQALKEKNNTGEAKMEGEKEISKFRDEQEEEFDIEKAEQHQRMEDLSEIEDKADAEINSIKQDFEENKEAVIEYLLESIKNVSLNVPRVVKGNFE